MNDDELIRLILSGDETAAEELVKRWYAPILRYCRQHCGSTKEAEDIVQETFLNLFRNLPKYKGNGKFKAYLYTIARHLCIDESRIIRFLPLEEENLVEDYDEILQIEDRAEIGYLLRTLPERQREAIILRFGEGLSFAEIAKVMGCNIKTAQSHVRCALKKMRKEKL